MIELKGVRKSYGTNEILKGIDLQIADQDYLVICMPQSGDTLHVCGDFYLVARHIGESFDLGSQHYRSAQNQGGKKFFH